MTDQKFSTEELETEEWRDIPGYNGRYQVSNLGRVRSVSIKILKPSHGWGNTHYDFASLATPKQTTRSIHGLVAEAFIGNRAPGAMINHKDGNKLNNRVENLEYCTPQENNLHAIRLGLAPIGERMGTAKLRDADVRSIIDLLASGKTTYELAAQFGVSDVVIGLIKRNKGWKHIPRPSSPHLGPLAYKGNTRGEDSRNAKITEENVREIRRLYATGKFTMKEIAETFGIGKSQTKRIIDKLSWRHVTQ